MGFGYTRGQYPGLNPNVSHIDKSQSGLNREKLLIRPTICLFTVAYLQQLIYNSLCPGP